MMRCILWLLGIGFAISARQAAACEWPDNWLGPVDQVYRALEIGVYYHAAVLHDLPGADGVSPLPRDAGACLDELAALPELTPAAMRGELDRVQLELAKAADFYWRNSRFNCALNYDWIVDTQPRLRSTIADAEPPYFRPVDHAYYGDARKRYDGLLQIIVLYVYDEASVELQRVTGGGGWTWGADGADSKCGWSWWAACTAENVCGSDWLVTHEFGHQLDSMFHESGHPEVWFNHLAPLEGNIARFGEHFDANSYILRRIPEQDWRDLRWGELKRYADEDGDHVPDADEWLASCRLTIDTDPRKTDADGDGLDDYAELMVSNGIDIGHGERLHPALGLCDPASKDTDGDGRLDGLDALPMLPMPAFIRQVEAGEEAAENRLSLEAPSAPNLALNLCYEERQDQEAQQAGRLMIELWWGCPTARAEECELKVMLDLDNDGWFAGSDNYRLEVTADGVREVVRHVASSHTEWPYEDREAVSASSIPVSESARSPQFTCGLTIEVPCALFPELAAKPGEEIGINIGIRRTGCRWFHMIGEPNTLTPVELR